VSCMSNARVHSSTQCMAAVGASPDVRAKSRCGSVAGVHCVAHAEPCQLRVMCTRALSLTAHPTASTAGVRHWQLLCLCQSAFLLMLHVTCSLQGLTPHRCRALRGECACCCAHDLPSWHMVLGGAFPASCWLLAACCAADQAAAAITAST
jgi:hypothetical protein